MMKCTATTAKLFYHLLIRRFLEWWCIIARFLMCNNSCAHLELFRQQEEKHMTVSEVLKGLMLVQPTNTDVWPPTVMTLSISVNTCTFQYF